MKELALMKKMKKSEKAIKIADDKKERDQLRVFLEFMNMKPRKKKQVQYLMNLGI